MKLRVFTAFSGYDSQCLALDRLKEHYPQFDYELVGWSEIDKYAIQAHDALYPQWADRNFGDISKIDWSQVPDFDLFTYSSPCQDFSNAGRQMGGVEGSGTRSSLLWECRRAILAKKPKHLLLENVSNLVSKKFRPLFIKWQQELSDYGYSNFAQLLNAKDYGVPQNRKRIFLVSILGNAWYDFPAPVYLHDKLRDRLSSKVPIKYYLFDTPFRRIREDQDCLKVLQIGVTKMTLWNRNQYRVYSINGISPCLNTCGGGGLITKILYGTTIRNLTPSEYLSLMGMKWRDIATLKSTNLSDRRIYALAGNSIVVDVLYYIFRNLFIENYENTTPPMV